MMQAFSGGIQFITVVLAIWGMLLIGLRWLWCSVQLRIVRDGQLLSVPEQEPIWAHVGSVSTSGSTLDHYRKRYGSAFVAVRLLDEAVELKAEAREPEVIGFVNDRIDLMETGVQKGEYLLIDYISYAVPNLGFIGTILGIILSMTSVVGILESSGVLDMVEAFEKVGGALGLAFDTTFVSLVGVLILSFLLARLQKREAEMFEALREKALRHLKYFWLSHGHAH